MNHVNQLLAAILTTLAAFLFLPGNTVAGELSVKAPDVGHMLPLYEVAIIERVCSDETYKTEIKKSRNECAKEMFKVVSECTADHQSKFPRSDNEKVGQRLDYREFSTLYKQCLKGRYAVLAAADIVEKPEKK